ncbi:MAG: hypothetical protein ACI841_004007 [Planctomycetota bacterium]|jgi:hypothetical protein
MLFLAWMSARRGRRLYQSPAEFVAGLDVRICSIWCAVRGDSADRAEAIPPTGQGILFDSLELGSHWEWELLVRA